jgi:tetratricopeptide (TPR) repeat protein
MSCRLHEGRHWLDRLLACEIEPNPVRINGLCVDGYLATVLSDFSAAAVLIEEARRLARRLGDASGTADVAQIRGLSALFQGDPALAVAIFEEALAAHSALADHAAIAYDQIQLALATTLLGDHRRAVGLFEDCLAANEFRGEHWIRALALWALGIEACRQGDHPRASAAEQQSIRLRLPLDDRRSIGLNLDVPRAPPLLKVTANAPHVSSVLHRQSDRPWGPRWPRSVICRGCRPSTRRPRGTPSATRPSTEPSSTACGSASIRRSPTR